MKPAPPADRDAILDDELTRATPGLRPFSVGILRLCRKLGLKLATGGQTDGDEASAREILTVAWLLDERHPLEQIKLAAADPAALAAALDAYEFTLAPSALMAVQAEIRRAEAAVAAATVTTVPKPGGSAGPAPPPNS